MTIFRYKKIFIIVILILIIIVLQNSSLAKYLTIENIIHNKNKLIQLTENNYLISSVSFILIYTISIAFSMPGAAILSITGGLLFNIFPGVLFINIGATSGAFAAFIAARYLLGNKIQKKYADSLKKFNMEIRQNGHYYLLMLRLIPIFPFFLINLLSGLTNIGLWTFVWTTSIGILPGSFVYTYAGKNLGAVDNINEIFNAKVVIAFIILGLFAIVPPLLQKILKKKSTLK